jgi:sec-independent protein translocase protein TatA
MNFGVTELLIIGAIVLLLFGPSKLPGLGKALGESIRGFKKGMKEGTDEAPVKSVNNTEMAGQLHPPTREVSEAIHEAETVKKS